MAAREIFTGIDARIPMLKGAAQVSRAVAVTYGPKGRLCLMDRFAGMLATKDGVTVAREVTLANSLENQGAQMLKQACLKVNDEVGDGTTTTAILAHALVKEGQKIIAGGVDPGGLVRGMYETLDVVLDEISNWSTSITTQKELERVAMLSSNGDEEVAKYLAEACMAVGKDGTVTVEDGVGMGITLEFKEGMELDQGPCSPAFLKGLPERVIENPLIAVIHGRLRSLADIQDLLECASQWPQNELVVFCLIAETEALEVMVVNDTKEVMKSVAIGAPGMQFRKQDYLQDIAALTGATFVDMQAGLDHKTWNPEWFGSLRKIIVYPKTSILIANDEASEAIQERLKYLTGEELHCVSDYDRDRLKERRAKLSGGMAILKIGDVTEAALKERRARVEDALGSVRAALRDGIVPGGGITFLRISEFIREGQDRTREWDAEDWGWEAVRLGLQQPIMVLASNADTSGDVVKHVLIEDNWTKLENRYEWFGWDAMTGEYRDLFEDPMVADPAAVTCAVFKAALSVAAIFLTVETAITLKEAS